MPAANDSSPTGSTQTQRLLESGIPPNLEDCPWLPGYSLGLYSTTPRNPPMSKSFVLRRNFKINVRLPGKPIETFCFMGDSPLDAISQLHSLLEVKNPIYSQFLSTSPTPPPDAVPRIRMPGAELVVIEQEPLHVPAPSQPSSPS
jgi:hypothetical protein